MPQRFNEIGLAGRLPGESDANADGSPGRQRSAGTLTDPFLRQYVIELPLVASAAEQDTGFTMPANAQAVFGFLRTKVASTAGTTEQVDVGVFGGTADALLNNATTDVVGIQNITAGANLSGANIGYTFAAADIVDFEGELVLTVIASDD